MASRKNGGDMVAEAVAENAAQGVSANGTAGSGEQGGEHKQPNGVYVSTPPELRTALEERAKTANTSAAAYVRDLLAKDLGVTLDQTARAPRQKYSSDDERKQAQTARRQERNELIKMLLKRHAEEQAAKSGEEAA